MSYSTEFVADGSAPSAGGYVANWSNSTNWRTSAVGSGLPDKMAGSRGRGRAARLTAAAEGAERSANEVLSDIAPVPIRRRKTVPEVGSAAAYGSLTYSRYPLTIACPLRLIG